MIKKGKNKNQYKKIFSKHQLLIIGISLLLLGTSIIGGKYLYDFLIQNKENEEINQFFELDSDSSNEDTLESQNNASNTAETPKSTNYTAVMEIPRISLKKGLYSIDSKNNNVDKNLEILQNSDMPNIKNGILAIAGHSGSGRTAYFSKLHLLNEDDLIYLYFNGIKYTYKVFNKYTETKDGHITITKSADKTELVLTTCDQTNKKQQVVIVAELINSEDY